MHIQESVGNTIPVESPASGSGVFGRDDAEKGVVLVSRAATPGNPAATPAAKSTAADQHIIGTLGGEGTMCKVTGEIVMQTDAAFSDAEMALGVIGTHTEAGKVQAAALSKFTAGLARKGVITRQGNDPTIGTWIAIIL